MYQNTEYCRGFSNDHNPALSYAPDQTGQQARLKKIRYLAVTLIHSRLARTGGRTGLSVWRHGLRGKMRWRRHRTARTSASKRLISLTASRGSISTSKTGGTFLDASEKKEDGWVAFAKFVVNLEAGVKKTRRCDISHRRNNVRKKQTLWVCCNYP